jgi:hypothetical protein
VGFLYYSIILINLTYSLSSFEKIPILPSRTYILSSQSSEKFSNDGIIPMTVSFNGQCYAGNRIGNIFFPLTSWILKGGFVLFAAQVPVVFVQELIVQIFVLAGDFGSKQNWRCCLRPGPTSKCTYNLDSGGA